jgi:uncharacterized protein (TIGR02246 family)
MSQIQEDMGRIEKIILQYIAGINQSNPDAMLPLFAKDAVLMAADAPTMEGECQLKAFFGQAFGAIKLEAELEFDEIVVTESYAFARSHSRVQVTVLQTNESHPEETRELFVLNKDAGEWKIARYMFNRVANSQ